MLDLELEQLGDDAAQQWDELISRYPGRGVFHERAWLEYLSTSRRVKIQLWAIRRGDQTLGYFCGGIVRKGPFRILGSPLRGWGTNFMGPVMDNNLEPTSFLMALDRLAHRSGLAMVELEQRMLSEEVMAGAGYKSETTWTYLVELTPGDPEAMLKRMHKARRYGIRKALGSSLAVEDSDDPGIADEYYRQFSAVMRRKGLVSPYPREYPRLLFQYLRKADRLFALRVRDARGQVLATGLFPHDDHTVYFWGGASEEEAKHLYANDLLHWQAMCLAAERGLRLYDMSGWGRFKKEFGGELITLRRWHKCHWRSAYWARRAYEIYSKKRLRLQGRWQRVAQSREEIEQ